MPKRNRAEYMKNYRQRKQKKEQPLQRKPRLDNEGIIQKVHAFLFSDDFPDPNDTISNTLAFCHLFHGSFTPSREEIAYMKSQFENLPSNIDVKLLEIKQKIVYSLMQKFNWNRTQATEAFQLWWLWRTKNTPEDVRQNVIELWKDYGKILEPKKALDPEYERLLKKGMSNLSPQEQEDLGIK